MRERDERARPDRPTRVSNALLDRADALVEPLSADEYAELFGHLPPSRTGVVRVCLDAGLKQFERRVRRAEADQC